MKKLTKNHPSARWMIFSGCSLIGRSHPVEPFSFTGARGISDVFSYQAYASNLSPFLPYTVYVVY